MLDLLFFGVLGALAAGAAVVVGCSVLATSDALVRAKEEFFGASETLTSPLLPALCCCTTLETDGAVPTELC